jgi:hypothetical protein
LGKYKNAEKLIEISTEKVDRRQHSRLTQEENQLLSRLKSREGVPQPALYSAEASLEYAKACAFERVSVARDYEILAEALRHGRGHVIHQHDPPFRAYAVPLKSETTGITWAEL